MINLPERKEKVFPEEVETELECRNNETLGDREKNFRQKAQPADMHGIAQELGICRELRDCWGDENFSWRVRQGQSRNIMLTENGG